MADCIVIDLKTRRRETVQPSRVDPMTGRAAEDRLVHNLAVVLERDLPTLSPSSPSRPYFERMLAACKRVLGDFSDVS